MKRSRGRGRRGPPNNHNRSLDSAGPDVKIRGTAANIYEKYLQFARDAGSAGDRVAQENYLQHAEHYYRILMANQTQYQQQQQGGYQQGQNTQPGGQPYQPQPQYGQQGHAGDGRGPGVASQPYGQPPPGSGPSFTLSDQGETREEGDMDEATVR
ncbi:MAG: DUF4167 domain-containing protein [Alphaproteobacteria bacterium]